MAVQSPRKPHFANVRASEGAGSTTLVESDYRHQVFNLSAARDVLLPSSGIVAGDTWTIENRGTGVLTLKSSDNTTIITLGQHGSYSATAAQATPTTGSHWRRSSPIANRWQRKNLSDNGGSQTTTGNKITFNNLVVGRVYRLFAQAFIDYQGNTTHEVDCRISHNSVDYGIITFRDDDGSTNQSGTGSTEAIFVAAATTAHFRIAVVPTGCTVLGNNFNETYAILEELNNYEQAESTAFT